MTDNIEKALKRIEGEVRVYVRGGHIVKIFAQEVKTQSKDGVQIVYNITEDITEGV